VYLEFQALLLEPRTIQDRKISLFERQPNPPILLQ